MKNGEWKIRLIVLNKQLIFLGADVACHGVGDSTFYNIVS